MATSTVQQLLQDAIRAEHTRKGLGFQVQEHRPAVQYGIEFRGPKGNQRNQRLNAKMLSRAIVRCGGCVNGMVAITRGGKRVAGQLKTHQDCNGLGLRINKRYGRCGSATKNWTY